MACVTFKLLVVVLATIICSTSCNETCDASNKNITTTSKDNVFFEKRRPLVIGHRGNPTKFQENTLAGFKSLLDLNVDGFETDIFLTKDEKLVLYHDLNTTQLTGTNNNIQEMTYADIQKLNIKKQLMYGNNVYTYSKTEKIPLLDDLLTEMKDSGLLMILEMKPSSPPYDSDISRKTGKAVAKMVKNLKLESRVVLSSFNPFMIHYAREEVAELNTCFLISKEYWKDVDFIKLSRNDLGQLTGFDHCLKNISQVDYGKYILENGSLVKLIEASAIDMDYAIFNNPKYSNNTFEMFKRNYGNMFSYGAWTIYKMQLSKEELNESEKSVEELIQSNAGRLYTDDAPRLLKKLGRPVAKSMATNLKSVLLNLLSFFVFVSLIKLIF